MGTKISKALEINHEEDTPLSPPKNFNVHYPKNSSYPKNIKHPKKIRSQNIEQMYYSCVQS